jgi:error-prone DNA polymerase
VAIRAVDVNASDWDCSLEPQRDSAGGLALRLGLRLVAGLQEAEARAILAARQARNGAPFASVEDVAWRTGVGAPALDALANADAFAGLGSNRRDTAWAARGAASSPRTLPLFALAEQTAAALAAEAPLLPEPATLLPAQTEGEAVVEDYRATGMTLRRHPLALLRPQLDQLGCGDTRQLNTSRARSGVRLPGLVLIRQRLDQPRVSSS